MKNIFISLVLGFVSCAAGAKTCTWVGSVDGNWSVASNWENASLPENGDTLVFASGSAATNDIGDIELKGVVFRSGGKFEIGGDGKLTFLGGSVISNDASVSAVTIFTPVVLNDGSHTSSVDEVIFKNSISGTGHLVHGGTKLSFTKNMPDYFGSIFATNAVIYPHRPHNGVHTYDHGAALGKRNAVHAKRFSIEGNGTWFDETNTNYLYYVRASGTDTTKTIHNYCGDVKMSGPVYFADMARVCGNGMVFEGPVYGNEQLTFDAGSTSREVVFGNIVSNGAAVSVSTACILRFKKSGNDYVSCLLNENNGQVVFEEEDAMSHKCIYSFWNSSKALNSGLVIKKGNQRCKRIAAGDGFVNTYVTSTVPSTITIKGDYAHAFSGRWQGGTTLLWSPTGPHKYTLSSAIEHSTNGRLVAEKGTLALTSGSAFPNLSGIEIRDAGTISIPSGVTLNPAMGEVRLSGTGTLELKDGLNVTVTNLLINGKRYWGPRVYGGTDCVVECRKVSHISGTGSITVVGISPHGAKIIVR